MKKKYVVYGLGVSGLSVAKFLAKNGEEVTATDDTLQHSPLIQEGLESSIKFQNPDKIAFDENTVISFSPGIPLYFPKQHKILEIIKKTGAQLVCDIELFCLKNNQSDFIAITGTNGKSTTVALTGFILKEIGFRSEIGGNIGVPCFEIPPSDVYVLETSSYQLDLLCKTHFKIAALLNITPDHLDRHGSMAAYIAAKKRIFRNQTKGDFALIDVDNENSKQVFDELKNDSNFMAQLVPVSTNQIQENGLALIDGVLFNRIGGVSQKIELKSEFLRGRHNEQNMAFTFAISYCYGGKTDSIIKAIKKFPGLRHRQQLLGEVEGIKFINDSKATNAESTMQALKAYDEIFWILGGRPKEGGIAELQPFFKKIVKAYLVGEATEEFAKILEKNSVIFEKCGDLKTAFEKAFSDTKSDSRLEKNILLSPACASLDQWKNFEQRGDYFCKLFDEIRKSS